MNMHTRTAQIVSEVRKYAHGNYDPSTLRSLVLSLPESVRDYLLSNSEDEATHYAIWSASKDTVIAGNVLYPSRYGTIKQAIERFTTKGTRQKARVELRVRLPYASYDEQKEIVKLMVAGAKTDRQWICRYFRDNWDDEYLSIAISLYELTKEYESAILVVKHASLEYIQTHKEDLIEATSYLQVRLRYPSNAPIESKRLNVHELLYLFAKQKINFNEFSRYADISNVLSEIILDAYHVAYRYGRKYEGFLFTAPVRRMNWCLSQLGQTDLILKAIELDNETRLHADDDTLNIIDILIGSWNFYAK